MTTTSAPRPSVNDHQHPHSDIVRAAAMPDASEDVPANPPTQDSSAEPAPRTPEIDVAASAPTQPGPMDAPAAMEPTRTSQPERPAAPDPTRTSQPGQPAPLDPTRTSQPGQHAPLDPTRTSQPGTATAAAPQSMPPQPSVPQPRNPARYHLLGEHGRGGLGKVSRAHDLELGRDVAIKELLSRSAMHEVRFMREALITARLEHPGIVPVHEAGRWPDGTPFYAMKLVAGRPLRDLLAERKTVDERLALLHHVIAVADAIAYAHGRNIIHRDLKPGNVIVGDFGETVVIDWGLAKDLSGSEESTTGGASLPISRDDDLTSAGAVLGTPAYMAPEQRRGDPVDQRADVYAIGAMLWELCSLEKLPPGDDGQRRRILHGSVVEQDLIAIIAKASDPDLKKRYVDAGTLAADLKAFKAGARIAARRYSLCALLAHWTRRHRTFATSTALALALSIVAGILYVRNIAAERDRADKAFEHAEHAKDALILEHAALLLHTDPTTALTVLSGYHGSDTMRLSELNAEAHGRGIARQTVRPHNDTIWFLAGQSDGSFISVGEDHRVQRTLGTITTNLASNVSYTVRCAFSATRGLLAYGASPRGMALMDLTTTQNVTLNTISPHALAFTPDGSRLAAIDKQGSMVVWQISQTPSILQTPSVVYRGTFPNTKSLHLPSSSRVLLRTPSGLTSLDLENSQLATFRGELEAVDAGHTYIAAAGADGMLLVLSPSLEVLATTRGCKQRMPTVTVLLKRDVIAFGCQEGAAGLARYSARDHSLAVIDSFDTNTADVWRLVVDAAETIIMAVSDRLVYVHDIDTKITKRLEGQGATISEMAGPVPGFRNMLTADVNGTVRIWDPLTPKAQAIARFPGVPFGSRFSRDGTHLAVFGSSHAIRLISMSDLSIITLDSHTEMVGGVHFSPDGRMLVSFSWDGTARIWRVLDGVLLQIFAGHRAIVEDCNFLSNDSAISVGDDGHLFRWNTKTGEAEVLLTTSEPLISLQVLSNTGDIVTRDVSGSLWLVSPAGLVRQVLQPSGSMITFMRASKDGRYLAIGREDGSVAVYRTSNWTIATSRRVGGAIARIDFDPWNRDIAILSEDSFAHFAPIEAVRGGVWHEFQVDAHDIAYSPDGDTVAISSREGGSWFYSIRRETWSYHRDHDIEISSGQFSPDGESFISLDHKGIVARRKSSTIFESYIISN